MVVNRAIHSAAAILNKQSAVVNVNADDEKSHIKQNRENQRGEEDGTQTDVLVLLYNLNQEEKRQHREYNNYKETEQHFILHIKSKFPVLDCLLKL